MAMLLSESTTAGPRRMMRAKKSWLKLMLQLETPCPWKTSRSNLRRSLKVERAEISGRTLLIRLWPSDLDVLDQTYLSMLLQMVSSLRLLLLKRLSRLHLVPMSLFTLAILLTRSHTPSNLLRLRVPCATSHFRALQSLLRMLP